MRVGNRYRRQRRRRSFVLTRLGRLGAIGATLGRCLVVASVGAAGLVWAWRALPFPWWVAPIVLSLWRAGEASSPVGRRRRGQGPRYESLMRPPPGVRAAVEDQAPLFAIPPRRLQVVVQRYGRGRARHLPLAAAAGWFGGGVVIIDDDLAAKSRSSRPGDGIDDEVRAVVAHELAHIYALHSLAVPAQWFSLAAIISVCATSAGYRRLVDGAFLLPSLVVHAAALAAGLALWALAMRWVSRASEYAADERAAVVLGGGAALAAALTHDFGSSSGRWRALFATHPPIDKRARRLATR